MSRFIVFLFFLAFTAFAVASVPISKKVTATGTATGKNIEQVKRQALANAKRNALFAAGVREQVSSNSLLLVGETGVDNLTSVAEEISLLSLEGQLRLLAEPQFSVSQGLDLITYSASISAEVFLDSAADSEFGVRVQGLAGSYHNGDEILFSITPSKQCYLRVFCFDVDDEHALRGSLYYPSSFFVDSVFAPFQSYNFPALPVQYCRSTLKQLTAQLSPYKDLETTIVVVVALKKQRPYTLPSVDFDSFLRWLSDIPIDQRAVFFQPFVTVR